MYYVCECECECECVWCAVLSIGLSVYVYGTSTCTMSSVCVLIELLDIVLAELPSTFEPNGSKQWQCDDRVWFADHCRWGHWGRSQTTSYHRSFY